MSHYAILVLIPETPPSKVEDAVGALLAPYSENLAVAPYEEPCFCVGRKARLDAEDVADKKVGSHDELRRRFMRDHEVMDKRFLDALFGRLQMPRSEFRELERERDRIWEEGFWMPHAVAEREAYSAHPLADKADPECPECKGAGVETTTCNPKGYWDWWVIGGRWAGDLCGDNVAPVERFLALGDEMWTPLAIVTPDGQWEGRGRVGWFGALYTERKDWDARARQILHAHIGATAVLCDLHK